MAGTVTTTEITHHPLKKVTFAWVTDSNGDADGETTEVYTGRVIFATEIPDSGGTQPTSAYDVVVTDSDGADVLAGAGANLVNNANTYFAEADLGAVVESKLTVTVSNAGDSKGGKVILYIR